MCETVHEASQSDEYWTSANTMTVKMPRTTQYVLAVITCES